MKNIFERLITLFVITALLLGFDSTNFKVNAQDTAVASSEIKGIMIQIFY